MDRRVDRAFYEDLLRAVQSTPAPEFPDDPAEFARLLHYDFTGFHRRWWDFVDSNRACLVLAPRGHGKSTVLTIAYTLHHVLADVDRRVLIASNTAAQAEAFLREIRAQLETNDHLIERLGLVPGRPWTEKEITLNCRLTTAKEATVTATGVLGPVISKHYDLIVLDDVVDEENARSRLRRDQLHTWYYKELLPTLEPHGKLHLVGTRYHHDDLYGRLERAGLPVLVERAISGEGEGERALWEEKFSLELLREKRRQAGPAIFNTQYQNDVRAMTGRVFKPEWILRRAEPPLLRLYQGVDLAIGQSDHHDYFALVTVGVAQDKTIQVLDVCRGRFSFEDQFRMIQARFDAHHRPDRPVLRVGVEANGYQHVMVERLRRESALPVVPIVQHKDKVTRALVLQAHFQCGRLFLPGSFASRRDEDLTALESELLTFPEGDHDDLVDALEIAVRLALEGASYQDLPLRPLDVAP